MSMCIYVSMFLFLYLNVYNLLQEVDYSFNHTPPVWHVVKQVCVCVCIYTWFSLFLLNGRYLLKYNTKFEAKSSLAS
jgi:hypothetical protein